MKLTQRCSTHSTVLCYKQHHCSDVAAAVYTVISVCLVQGGTFAIAPIILELQQ